MWESTTTVVVLFLSSARQFWTMLWEKLVILKLFNIFSHLKDIHRFEPQIWQINVMLSGTCQLVTKLVECCLHMFCQEWTYTGKFVHLWNGVFFVKMQPHIQVHVPVVTANGLKYLIHNLDLCSPSAGHVFFHLPMNT